MDESKIAQAGELRLLREKLERQVRSFHYGITVMNEHEKLTDEALTFARLGDLDEAKHLLRLRDRPKWRSIDACKQQYAAAMKEKRARGLHENHS